MKDVLAFLVLVPACVFAQGAPASRPPLTGPPIRQLPRPTRVAAQTFGAVNGVRQLPDGRLLVNDGFRRRLSLFDSTLTTATVVLDSIATTTNRFYGTALGGLLPYLGDSSLFVDRGNIAILVIDPAGRVVRQRAAPTTTYLSNLTSGNTIPGTDPSGRLVIRIKARPGPTIGVPGPIVYVEPDTSFMVRMHIDTRALDTAGVVRIPRLSSTATLIAGGVSIIESAMIDPFPTTDEWAVLSDGTIAYVRGYDYHVEFQDDHNKVTVGPKLPYNWVRLTDDDRTRIVDSISAIHATRYYRAMMSWVNAFKQSYPADFAIPASALPLDLPSNWVLPAGVTFPADYVHGPPYTPPALPAALAGRVPPMPTLAAYSPRVVPPDEWPTYRPPFSAGAVRSDGDGGLWIRTNQVPPMLGGTIYDIVNRQGELVDRVQLPAGRTVVGFGAGHVVYLSRSDAGAVYLERVQWK